MNDAILACDSAIDSGDASGVPDTILNINPDYRDAQYTKIGLINGNSLKQVLFFVLKKFSIKQQLICLLEWI